MSSLRSSIKQLFLASRPISWVNTAYPFAAGYIVISGAIDWLWLVGTIFFLIPYNLLMYGINDIYDYESDIRNPRKDSIEGALLKKSMHKTVLWSAILLTMPFVAVLVLMGQTIASCLTLLFVVFMAFAYSAPPLRLKERPFFDSITSSVHFVGPLLYALVLVGGLSAAWPYVIAFFLWGVASHAFGAVQDISSDRIAGIGSIAVKLGARATVRFALLCYLAAAIVLLLQGGYAYIVSVCCLLYVLNVLPYLQLTDASSSRANNGWRRFLVLNYVVGAIVTICLLLANR